MNVTLCVYLYTDGVSLSSAEICGTQMCAHMRFVDTAVRSPCLCVQRQPTTAASVKRDRVVVKIGRRIFDGGDGGLLVFMLHIYTSV